jgi:hypothetical protein
MQASRGLYGLLLVIILSGLGGLAASCQPSAEPELPAEAQPLCNLPTPVMEDETMNPSENEAITMQNPDIPPIDAAVPARTMTATFSLG